MKTILTAIILIFSVATISAQNSIEGIWNMGQGNTKVEIKENEGKVKASDKLDAGMLILKDIKADGDHYTAILFNAQKEKWYDAELKNEDGVLKVTVKAGMIKKTLEWSKV